MAKLTVPIKVSGIDVMRNALDGFSVKWDPDVTKDYQEGFMDCLTIVKKVLDALEEDR